jgi:hypothetical protein
MERERMSKKTDFPIINVTRFPTTGGQLLWEQLGQKWWGERVCAGGCAQAYVCAHVFMCVCGCE